MLAAAGVDTWSVCWHVGDQTPACRALEALATDVAPRSRLLPESVAGHRVGWFPGNRLMFAEGHPREEGLASGSDMQTAFEALVGALADRGILPPQRQSVGKGNLLPGDFGDGFGGVRRLDSTVDLHFDDPIQGVAALAGVAALPLPRCKTKILRESGGRRVETVYFHGYGGRKVLGRWYDKSVESGCGERGSWVRPEDQRRYGSGGRLPLEVVTTSSYVRDAFVQRFEPLWRAGKGVKVAGVTELAVRLHELVEDGLIKPSTAKALAGHLVLDAAGVEVQSRSTRLADRAKCRNLGLVLADGVLDEVEVDLGEVLEAALDSEAWGAQG